MKLNKDCIRDLLIYLEDNLSYTHRISTGSLSLKDYTRDELVYTVERLSEAGFINVSKICDEPCTPTYFILSLTYNGHQFLDTIRDNSIWKNTKTVASQLASVSLPIIQEIAISFIKTKLGLS